MDGTFSNDEELLEIEKGEFVMMKSGDDAEENLLRFSSPWPQQNEQQNKRVRVKSESLVPGQRHSFV